MTNYKLNTIIVFLFSVAFTCFFFFSKHYYLFSKVNVFSADPYDGVGSIGIQVSFFAALLSIARILMIYFTGTISNTNLVMVIRGNLVSLLSIAVTLISDNIAMFRFLKEWTDNPAGYVLLFIIGFILILMVFLGYWTLVSAKKINIKIGYKFIPKLNILILLLFLILAIYPEFMKKSILGEIFTAYIGMAIQIIIVYCSAKLLQPSVNITDGDLIDVISNIYVSLKNRNSYLRYFSNKLEKILYNVKKRAIIDFFNPRKHNWNFIILIGLIVGIAFAIIEGAGEHWIGFSKKALLLFLIFISGEFMVIISFYLLFRHYLGIIIKKL